MTDKTDTSVDQLVINRLTKAQFNSITPSDTELYFITDDSMPVTLDTEQTITGIKHFNAGSGTYDNAVFYNDDTYLLKPTIIKAGGGDAVNINAGTDDTYFGKPVTIDAYLKTNELDNASGNALVRFKETEAKNVFGGVNYDAVLMGKSDRPYYSKSGSDFNGSALALASDITTMTTATSDSTEVSE